MTSESDLAAVPRSRARRPVRVHGTPHERAPHDAVLNLLLDVVRATRGRSPSHQPKR